MDKKCIKKLKDLIENVVLLDIEDYLDDLFEDIASNKNASDADNDELKNMHEMREEFQGILEDIKENNLDQEDCSELLSEITQMIKENQEEQV